LFILPCRNFCTFFFIFSIIGCVKVVAATAVTAAMLVVTKTSVEGIGIGGKFGIFNLGAGGASVLVALGFTPCSSLRSLGGTTKGT
tara:strand:+ start:210 stop:467 length:258 start_codon:yes stop_codon:yes gene_type:complete